MYKSLDLSSLDLEAIQFGLKMHLPKPLVNLVHLGITKYLPTLKLQQHLVQKVKLSRPSVVGNSSSDNYCENANFLLILQHYPVYTTGIRNRNNYQKEAEERTSATDAEMLAVADSIPVSYGPAGSSGISRMPGERAGGDAPQAPHVRCNRC